MPNQHELFPTVNLLINLLDKQSGTNYQNLRDKALATRENDEALNDFQESCIQALLDTALILDRKIEPSDPAFSYQQHYEIAFKQLMSKLQEAQTKPFSKEEFTLIHDALLTPIHLKIAKNELTKDQILKTKLTVEMKTKMFNLLDPLFPKEKAVSQFDFFGEKQKGQSLRHLLIEYQAAPLDEAINIFKEIVYQATEQRIQRKKSHSTETETAKKIIEGLLGEDNADLRQAFFANAVLSKSNIKDIFKEMILEKDALNPPPYSGL